MEKTFKPIKLLNVDYVNFNELKSSRYRVLGRLDMAVCYKVIQKRNQYSPDQITIPANPGFGCYLIQDESYYFTIPPLNYEQHHETENLAFWSKCFVEHERLITHRSICCFSYLQSEKNGNVLPKLTGNLTPDNCDKIYQALCLISYIRNCKRARKLFPALKHRDQSEVIELSREQFLTCLPSVHFMHGQPTLDQLVELSDEIQVGLNQQCIFEIQNLYKDIRDRLKLRMTEVSEINRQKREIHQKVVQFLKSTPLLPVVAKS